MRLSILNSTHNTPPNTRWSRSVDNPFYQAVPTHEVALALGTTIAVASEPSRESTDGSRPHGGNDPSNTGDSYIAMNPIGTLGTLV